MPFAIDAQVVVTALGKTGRVVEASRGGRYRVRVGAVLMQCREDELTRASAPRRGSKRPAAEASVPDRSSPSEADRRRLGSLDLHGFTVDEALGKVEERIDMALRAGLERLDIIHGRSSGRIKVAVHRLLRELSAVRSFEVPTDNPGVTYVFF